MPHNYSFYPLKDLKPVTILTGRPEDIDKYLALLQKEGELHVIANPGADVYFRDLNKTIKELLRNHLNNEKIIITTQSLEVFDSLFNACIDLKITMEAIYIVTHPTRGFMQRVYGMQDITELREDGFDLR